jgi:hypothetical protein
MPPELAYMQVLRGAGAFEAVDLLIHRSSLYQVALACHWQACSIPQGSTVVQMLRRSTAGRRGKMNKLVPCMNRAVRDQILG